MHQWGFGPPTPFTQPTIPRLTKSRAEELIALSLGVPVGLKFTKLSDQPREWKHACVPTGVVVLCPNRIPYDITTGIFIDFVVCPACGGVLYYYEGGQGGF